MKLSELCINQRNSEEVKSIRGDVYLSFDEFGVKTKNGGVIIEYNDKSKAELYFEDYEESNEFLKRWFNK